MGLKDIQQNKQYSKPLTVNDENQLKKMIGNNDYSIFQEVIQYMLENKIKLEQESFDL